MEREKEKVSSLAIEGWSPYKYSSLKGRAKHTMVASMKNKEMSTSFGDKLTCSLIRPWGKDPAGHKEGSPEPTEARPPAGGARATPVMAGGSPSHPCLAQPGLCDLGQGPESSEPQKHSEF